MAMSLKAIFDPAGKTGTIDKKTGRMNTTPMSFRNDDGIYVGANGQVWLYWVLPTSPLVWEDPGTRLMIGGPLHEILVDLGATSRKSLIPGFKFTSDNREFHICALQWDERPTPPKGTSDDLASFMNETFSFKAGHKLVFVGTKLRSGGTQTVEGQDGIIPFMTRLVKEATTDDIPNLNDYKRDFDLVASILARNGCRRPTLAESRHMESWYNLGRGTDCTLVAEPSGKSLSSDAWPDGIELSALVHFDQTEFQSPADMWAADAFSHEEGLICLSVRGDLMPAEEARNEFRKAQRKALSQIEEQSKTGDLERVEDHELFQLANSMESYFAGATEPLLTNCSILLARRATKSDDTYADALRSQYGFEVKPLEHRQMLALDETLPCSDKRLGRTRPFAQDLTVGMLAYSGLMSFSAVGDDQGVFIGLAPPDMSPVFLDPKGSSTQDKPPAMAVVGEPGSGKTFLCQLIAFQAALQGHTSIVINPKPSDSLRPFAELVDGEVITISALENEPGALDPFRYAPAQTAAEIATAHILSMLVQFTEYQEVELASGIKAGAMAGAKCVGDALKHVSDTGMVDLIRKQCEGSSLFSLGISWTARPPLGFGDKGKLTLIEFDRPVSLPTHVAPVKEYDRETRASVAAMRLVTRASLEMLFKSGGGVLVVDEAHVFLSSKEGVGIMQRIGREGRSQGILPILATQRIADLIETGVDMESYIGRVMALKMTDPREVRAALRMVGLEPTPQRIQWLANAGAVKGTPESPGRGALGFFRDLAGRRSATMVGPVPEYVRLMFSTNHADRAARQAIDEARAAGRGETLGL